MNGTRILPDQSGSWNARRSVLLLVFLTLLCLAPFARKAFHIDDPLFVWSAQQIAKHPLDPYGFDLVWSTNRMRMSEVNKNPPLASYFIAFFASMTGWSEAALHTAFLLPAIAVVIGTYWLARRFTRSPLLAATTTLLAPGFLVSSTTVMCDTLMLAFWVFALVLWCKGVEPVKPLYLAGSALMIAAAALTKYFAVSLIPLLLVYSHARRRRFGHWAWFLLLPVLALAVYQSWTASLYGTGLLTDAAVYARAWNGIQGGTSIPAKALIGTAFAGGCMLPVLLFAPLCWRLRWTVGGLLLAGFAGATFGMGWLHPGAPVPDKGWVGVQIQLALLIAGGLSVMALAADDLRKRNDADALFLAAWVLGTLYFACFMNWTVNARSVMPLIPAASILLARRVDSVPPRLGKLRKAALMIPLAASALISLQLARSDAELAGSAREAARLIHEKARPGEGTLWFEGHWGFQYYMQRLGAQPLEEQQDRLRSGDVVAIPRNNTATFALRPGLALEPSIVSIDTNRWLTTMSVDLGAGFYASVWGPLPFAFGRVPPEIYELVRIELPALKKP